MRKIFGSLFLVVAFALPGVLFAHEGHHHVLGTVKAVDAAHLEVRTKDGKTVTVPLNDATKYYQGSKGRSGAAATDIKAGMRVVVDLGKDGRAEQVRIGATKPRK